jgi:membrane-associated phospholipid phosphatase
VSDRVSAQTNREAHALANLVALSVVAWLTYVGVLMLLRGGTVTPDLLLVVAALVAVAVLADRPVLRELWPFPLIVLTWEAMRGLSADLVTRAHASDIVGLERALFGGLSGGRTPSEALQSAFHVAGTINPLDVVATIVYLGHFVAPVVIGFVIWRLNRAVYYRYAIAMVLVALAGYATQLIFPVAPPRLAFEFGSPLAVHDIVAQVLDAFRFVPFAAWGYGNLPGNELAAFPSLHAAFPLVGAFFLARVSRRAAWLTVAWSALVWFAIVYLGQHYLVDAVAGLGYAAVVCAITGHASFDAVTRQLAAIRLGAPIRLAE